MTPNQLTKSGTEHGHQAALFAYCAVAYLHGFDVADEWTKTGKLPQRSPDAPPAVPALQWFHAIHNQGHGDKVRGANAKAEGVRKGVADTFLPWPVYETVTFQADGYFDDYGAFIESEAFDVRRVKWCGLYIEMKKPTERPKREGSKGGVSDEQAAFGEYARAVGYGFIVCYGWEHAVTTLRSYIEWGTSNGR